MEVKVNKKGIKPLKKGEKVKVMVISKGKHGDGLANYGETNFKIIVKNGKVGRDYNILIKNVVKNMAFGEVIK